MASSDYIHFYFIRRVSTVDLTDDKLLLVVIEGVSGDLQVELEVGICRQLSVLKGSGRADRAGWELTGAGPRRIRPEMS